MDRRTYLKTSAVTLVAVPTAGCFGTDQQGGLSAKAQYIGLQQAGEVSLNTESAQEANLSRPTDPTNVMKEKVNQAANTLKKTGQGTQVYEAAIAEGMEGLFLSNLAVLPTEGVSAAQELFDTWNSHADVFEGALDTHITETGTSESKAKAIDGRNFLQVTAESMNVIGKETAKTDPSNPESSDLISQPDDPHKSPATNSSTSSSSTESVTTLDIMEGFHRQVRSPFFMGKNLATSATEPEETTIKTDELWPGQCQTVVKETRGVKVVVRPVVVPIWAEPWNARARIVGTELIWVWEFIPAEYIKTLEYCNKDGDIVQEVNSRVVTDEKLMHFWRFF